MILKIYSFVCLILLYIPIFSQNNDSLVKKIDLNYKNTEEKLAFTKTDLSNPDSYLYPVFIS